MKQKTIYTIISLTLIFSMLSSCGKAKDTIADTNEPPDVIQDTEPDIGSVAESGTGAPTEPSAEHDENVILNRNDTFIKDTITVNNSDFVIPDEQQQALYNAMNYNYYRYYDVAFYVIDIESRMSFGYNADDYFEPACTRKAGLALSWYMILEENRKKKRGRNTVSAP